MKKTIITRKVAINAPKQEVWDALADFGNVQSMSPNVAKSYLTSEVPNGIGATRHCDFTAMSAEVEEKIVGWEEGKSITIDITESKNMPMITAMSAHFELDEQDGKVMVTGTFQYGMTNALGDLMNSLAMKNMNEKSWVKFIAGIKHHVETGVDVDKTTALDLTVVQK
jgi:carbon monoxide dehydrogenase subunit G